MRAVSVVGSAIMRVLMICWCSTLVMIRWRSLICRYDSAGLVIGGRGSGANSGLNGPVSCDKLSHLVGNDGGAKAVSVGLAGTSAPGGRRPKTSGRSWSGRNSWQVLGFFPRRPRKSPSKPGVPESPARRESKLRIPLEAAADEVDE